MWSKVINKIRKFSKNALSEDSKEADYNDFYIYIQDE